MTVAKPRGMIAVDDLWNLVQDKKNNRSEMAQQFKVELEMIRMLVFLAIEYDTVDSSLTEMFCF